VFERSRGEPNKFRSGLFAVHVTWTSKRQLSLLTKLLQTLLVEFMCHITLCRSLLLLVSEGGEHGTMGKSDTINRACSPCRCKNTHQHHQRTPWRQFPIASAVVCTLRYVTSCFCSSSTINKWESNEIYIAHDVDEIPPSLRLGSDVRLRLPES